MKRLTKLEQIARNPMFKAFGRQTISTGAQVDLALAARMAFDAACKGTFNDADRDTLAGTVNVCAVLAETDLSEADWDTCIDAQEAMMRADARCLDGKTWGFDGPGRTAVLETLNIHEQLLSLMGQHALAKTLIEIQDRQARGQVHRLEVS